MKITRRRKKYPEITDEQMEKLIQFTEEGYKAQYCGMQLGITESHARSLIQRHDLYIAAPLTTTRAPSFMERLAGNRNRSLCINEIQPEVLCGKPAQGRYCTDCAQVRYERDRATWHQDHFYGIGKIDRF